jgi:hypothetical protein
MRKLFPLLLVSLLAGATAGAAAPPLLRLALGVSTPNMGLTLPDPGSSTGPGWASTLNTALQGVDAHDHTPGKGARVPAAGLNVNGDLACNDHALSGVGSVVLTPDTFPLSHHTLHDCGDNLCYVDGDGNDIGITFGGAVNVSGSARGINGQYATDPAHPSAFYTTAQGRYTLTTNGSTRAALAASSLLLGTFPGAAGTFTISDTDGYAFIGVGTAAPRTITLPVAANNVGRVLVIKDNSGSAGTNNITIARQGSDVIDGATSLTINTSRGIARLVSLGSGAWMTW